MRRRAIAALFIFLGAALVAGPARAQDWPQRPVKIVVPYGPAAICREPELVKTVAIVGIEAVGNTPEEFAAAIEADLPVMRSAVEAAGLLRK